MLAGLSGIVLVEVYAAVMQMEFQNSQNYVGKGFAVLGVYLFAVAYCELCSFIRRSISLTLFKTECSTARPGCMAQRCCQWRSEAKLWDLLQQVTSLSTLQ